MERCWLFARAPPSVSSPSSRKSGGLPPPWGAPTTIDEIYETKDLPEFESTDLSPPRQHSIVHSRSTSPSLEPPPRKSALKVGTLRVATLEMHEMQTLRKRARALFSDVETERSESPSPKRRPRPGELGPDGSSQRQAKRKESTPPIIILASPRLRRRQHPPKNIRSPNAISAYKVIPQVSGVVGLSYVTV